MIRQRAVAEETKGYVVESMFRRLRPLWRDMAGSGKEQAELRFDPDLSDKDLDTLRHWIDLCLSSEGSPVTARERTLLLGRSFLELNDQGRQRFLLALAEHSAIQPEQVEASFDVWRNASEEDRGAAEAALRKALDPPSIKLLARFNGLPSGIKFLVDMRAELLRLKKEEPRLTALEADLKNLLAAWFDIGLLQLEQITWDSGAELLEKLIAYEAVHEINGWDDLKNRLEEDRRCFAFFHANMPKEPLIFVEVALVKGISENITDILDKYAPVVNVEDADTAVFYSISNTQKGLAGISLGDFLIKRVVATLKKELPWIRNFTTLSPIPGFADWMRSQPPEDLSRIAGVAEIGNELAVVDEARKDQPVFLDTKLAEPLRKLAAHYLVKEKNRRGLALDPVANFHLSNGAQVKRINWLADTSRKGMRQSLGLMANYLYEPDFIEERSREYSENRLIPISGEVNRLLRNS